MKLVTAISAGESHSCAVRGGGVWCWGGDSLVPVAVSGLTSGVTSVSVGSGDRTCAVKDSGAWCWVLDSDLNPVFDRDANGNNSTTGRSPAHVVTAVAPGFHGTCVVADGGAWCWSVFPWGDGSLPVAVPGLASGVTAVSGRGGGFAADRTCAVKDGSAWCWGDNYDGGLGNNSTENSDVPVPVSGMPSGVSAISVGWQTCAVKDGGAWCWGDKVYSGSLVPVPVPGLASGVSAISVGGDHTCAVKDGGAWCWGSNGFGQLGNNGSQDRTEPGPVPVSGLTTGVIAISAGYRLTCAVKDGSPWCWGAHVPGIRGTGDGKPYYSPVPLAVLFDLPTPTPSPAW